MKIKSIERSCELHKWRIDPLRYNSQAINFYYETGVNLASLIELETVGYLDLLRVVSNDVILTITLEDSQWFQYKFSKGFVWDTASVPRIARWLINNDDIDLVDAAIVHDANYRHHFLDLDDTNELFKQMIRHRGKKIKAAICYAAVNSIYGRAVYHKASPTAQRITAPFVEFAGSTLKKEKQNGN